MSDLPLDRQLPVGAMGRASVGWWGVLCIIVTEGALFAYLLFAYFYFSVQVEAWAPNPPPMLVYTLPGVIALILSAASGWWAQHSIRYGRRIQLMAALAITALLGIAFAVLQVVDWLAEPFSLQSGEFGSNFYTITGLHMAHAVIGIFALLMLLAWSALGYFDARRHAPVLVGITYWYFLTVVGAVVFLCLYAVPRIWW
jgi:cytochrome c oxidase subunit III